MHAKHSKRLHEMSKHWSQGPRIEHLSWIRLRLAGTAAVGQATPCRATSAAECQLNSPQAACVQHVAGRARCLGSCLHAACTYGSRVACCPPRACLCASASTSCHAERAQQAMRKRQSCQASARPHSSLACRQAVLCSVTCSLFIPAWGCLQPQLGWQHVRWHQVQHACSL